MRIEWLEVSMKRRIHRSAMIRDRSFLLESKAIANPRRLRGKYQPPFSYEIHFLLVFATEFSKFIINRREASDLRGSN